MSIKPVGNTPKVSLAALVLIAAVVFVSCNTKKKTPVEAVSVVTQPTETPIEYPKDSFAVGKVISQVSMAGNPSESFALYLPKGYSDTVKYPVIIFLDIYGQGSLPLDMYKGLADKHHYILVGSNNFSKKFATPEATAVAGRLVKEITERFKIDEKHVALCGYGNGAKGSIETAYNNAKVTQVVYIGAVADIQQPNHSLDMLGFAGVKDLNYANVLLFASQAMPANLHNYTTEFSGKQEWVDAKNFELAFTPSFSDIAKEKLVVVDDAKKDQLKKESALRAELKESMKTRDLAWWKNQIADMNRKRKTDPMMDRLLGYLSLGCYSLSNAGLQQHNMAMLDKIIPLYEMVEPGNEDLKKFKEEYRKLKGN
jgi:hypothetical protein